MSDKKFNNRNLREAIDNSRMTREQIADKVQCDTSSITKYYNGDRYPKTDVIIKLAKLFNVSTDYLLGVTDVATTDKDLKFVCDYTGLDEKIINFFANNKDLNNNNFEVVEFIKFIISKVILNDDYIFSLNLEDIRDKTSWLFSIYEKDSTLLECNADDFNLNYDYYRETAEDLKLFINGSKYKLNNYLTKWIDEFALTYIENMTIETFEKIENEFFKNNLTEN